MSVNKKVFFIINKFSGNGYQESVEGKIISACLKHDLDCTIEFTKDRGHAIELARKAVNAKFDQVFAVGGDGTINETAQGLLGSGLAMGILPKGSGNGLARHLGISTRFASALDLLKSSSTISMDTISINNKLSVNVSGIGFDGHIAGLFGKNGKRGLAGYTRLVLKEYLRYKEYDAEVKVDQEVLMVKCFIIALANSSQFGNNATIAPHASVCDEWIDICFIRKVPVTRLIAFASKMFFGQLDKSSFVKIKKGKKLELILPNPVAYHIDGEPQTPTDYFNIEIRPGSLRMLVPSSPRKRPI